MAEVQRVFSLKGVVQNYAWGGYDFIPSLLGIENTERKPFAEYWLGAHPNHPSLLSNDEKVPLNDFITTHPSVLGEEVARKFSSLPYLFKILDVRQMLSIQVHPDKKSAEHGFDREEEAGIPVTAPQRNYRDRNHKPEFMLALSDFWLLHGFKDEVKLTETFDTIAEFNFFIPLFYETGYEGLYKAVMEMPQERVDEILAPLMQRIIPMYKSGEIEKSDEHFWAARAAVTFCKDNCYDRGIFSVYFLNLLHLEKGDGIFQPAGMPHAYLEGQNVEVMANSDNVLRAGLTDKHIDVPELLKHVTFQATTPKVIRHKKIPLVTFETPAEEFALQKIFLDTTYAYITDGAEIIFVLNGDVSIFAGEEKTDTDRGEAAFIAAGTSVVLQPAAEAEVFRVYVP